MAGISSKAAGTLHNKNKYNGKELQSEEFTDGSGLEEYDYGARHYNAQIGRFFVQDRFVEKYMDMNPYQYVANNPVLFIDINGDSLDVSDLRDKHSEANEAFKSDLIAKTGLILNEADNGNVTYASENGKPIVSLDKNGKKIGSKSARKALMRIINSKQTIKITANDDELTRTESDKISKKYNNTMNFNVESIMKNINNTSPDMDNTTFGFAMTFFHEIRHTKYGGRKEDPEGNTQYIEVGPCEQLANKIRRELGVGRFGQRVIYGHLGIISANKAFWPFSDESLRLLNQNQVPTSKVIIAQ